MGLHLELQMCIVFLFYLRVVIYNMVCIMSYWNLYDESIF